MHILDSVDAANLRSDIPDFRPGDTVKKAKIKEKREN